MNTTRLTFIKSALVLLTVTAGLSLGHPSTVIETNRTISAERPSKYDGGSDYATYCTRCHGSDGRSQTTKGRQTKSPDLTKSRVGDAKAIRMVLNGSGEMPSFKKSMDAARIRDVVAYARSLR